MFQRKEQDKILGGGGDLSEIEVSNLPDKEFKVMVIKILTNLGRRMGEHRENFNKETENIRKYQTEIIELKNIITELKSTLEEFNRRDQMKLEKGSVIWKTGQRNSCKHSIKKKRKFF